MTATKHITIWCDYTGPHPTDEPHESVEPGEQCVEWVDHGLPTAEATRKETRRQGWTRKRIGMGYEDHCPRHSQ